MKRGVPERGEAVVCKITKLHPNSAFAQLLEYDKTGMIHVSEVASRWVRDIREFLKENQYVVCRVLAVDDRGISLSIKRIRREEGNRKLTEFKREKKAENLLEQIAKKLKKTREQAFKEAGFIMQEEFGSLGKAFEMAVKDPALLKKKGIPPAWVSALTEAAKKKFAEKIYTLKGELELISYQPQGVDAIKKILQSAQKKGFQISYIAAPRYRITGKSKDIKQLRASLESEGEAAVEAIQKEGGEGKFVLKE
ncbi:MAG: S1 RNA-binding domain-containing protein [Candidatus Aenigmarchaeota archaeon]|nr:S1 RNA-binding domain-containing protein [Candidatus Aenigmarchaeota archaeon]